MAEVILKNIKKVYPHQEPKKKKKGEEPAKKTNLQITDEGVVAVQAFNLDIKDKEFIVLVGPSGCGKSTLMNLLSGCERSIVTDVPGTTRDIVEQTVRVGENLLRLADTAGIRDTDNKIESIGVELAKKRLSRAELVIAVFDGAQKLTDEDMEIIDFCSGRRSLAVVNKSDLGFVCDTA